MGSREQHGAVSHLPFPGGQGRRDTYRGRLWSSGEV